MTLRPILLAAVLAACTGGGDDPPVCETSGRYLELSPGASWTYRVTDADNVRTEKTQTVGPLEDVGGAKAGTMAYRMTTVKPGGMVISWQTDTGSGVIRHREQDLSGANTTDEIYAAFRTRIDESAAHLAVGAAWDESYTETVSENAGPPLDVSKVEHWEVVAEDEVVSVPAGEFCALHIHRTSTVGGVGGSDKHYWFVRGVGKVKEAGANQTEELAAFTR